ncbi:hypothetical protein EMCRGX_G021785 [Ephydatia muelleri]
MPKTVSEAVATARRLEAVEAAHKRLQTGRNADEPLAAAVTHVPAGWEDTLHRLTIQVERLVEEVTTLKKEPVEEPRRVEQPMTLLSAHVWEAIKPAGDSKLHDASHGVVTADGSALTLVGQANVLVSVGGLVRRHCVLVAQSLTQECILGADFLVANDCIIDYHSKTLLAGGQLVPIHCREQYQPVNVACTCGVEIMEDIFIPKQCEMLIPVRLTRHKNIPDAVDGFCGLLEPESQFMERHRLAVAHSISRNKKGVTMAQAMNPNPTAVKIHKGEKVGKLQIVDEHQCVCVVNAPVTNAGEREELRELLHRFSDVIISVSDTDIGRTDMVQHSIDTPNSKLIKQGPLRLPFHHHLQESPGRMLTPFQELMNPWMETATIARVLVNEFISRFGAPTHLHTDQGRSFESSLIKEICRLMGIVKTRTTPYHPQSDGMIERFNRTLLSMLRMAAVDDETNWDLRIPCLMLAYRTSIHEATKHTPFSLMFGREVQLHIDVMYGLPSGTEQPANVPLFVKDLRKWMSEAYERVRSHLSSEQRRYKQLYDVKVAGKPFTRGSKVWLNNPVVPRGQSRKLHRFWKGPYTVVDVWDNCVYKIKQDAVPHKQHTVHFDRLKPYVERVLQECGTGSSQGDELDMMVLPLQDPQEATPPSAHVNGEAVEPLAEADEQAQDIAPPTDNIRRSTRQRWPPERLGTWVYF